MATYLSMCQKLDTLIGSQGAISSVTAGGYQGMLAEYVKNAWTNIQVLRKDWNFLRSTVNINLTTASQNYTILQVFPSSLSQDPVGEWIVDRFLLSDRSTLTYIPYDIWVTQDYSDAGPPKVFTIHPSSSTGYLSFNAVDSSYTVTAHYFRKPQILSAGTDSPICPSEFHDAIVFTAMADLGAFLGNSEIYSMGATKADAIIGAMLRQENPAKRVRTRGIC